MKQQKGITIVALIITIIVLLILAVVTIQAISGDGVIIQARKSKEETRAAGVQEKVGLWKQELEVVRLTSGQGDVLTTEELVDNLVEQKLLTEDEKDVILGNDEKEIEAEYKIKIGSRIIYFSTEDLRNGIPGLYETRSNILIRTWDELTSGDNPYITVENNVITNCRNDLKNITGDLVIAEGITKIEKGFSGCNRLTQLILPSTLETISSYAIYGCTGLKSIIIPKNVKTIGLYVFSGCTNLSEIRIQSQAEYLAAGGAFNNCGSSVKVIYEDGVPRINPIGCTNCTSVIIPNSATGIYNSAFSGYTKLSEITIPNSVTGISMYAFYGCIGLKDVVIPDNVGAWEFQYLRDVLD